MIVSNASIKKTATLPLLLTAYKLLIHVLNVQSQHNVKMKLILVKSSL